MTISSTTRRAGPFTGNGVTTVFPFAFKVFNTSEVVVTSVITATGVETTHVLLTDYTVALNADQDVSPGGSVTMLVAPASTKQLVLTSNVPMTQEVLVTNPGGFYPAVFNNEFDKLTILNQQLDERMDRSLVFPVTSDISVDVVPSANGVLAFNAAADGIVTLTIDELAGLTANNTLIDDDMVANSTTRASSKTANRTYIDAQVATLAAADTANLSTANGNALVFALILGD